MKKGIMILAVMLFLVQLFILSFSFAQPVSGIVSDQGKVKQPMDTTTTTGKMTKQEAARLGRNAARQFYNGQITQEEADRRCQEMQDENLRVDYMRGYNTWKGQNVIEKKEEKKQEGQPAEENKAGY